MEQSAVGETPQARDSLVPAVVILEVGALQFPLPLSTRDAPGEIGSDVLFEGPLAEHHAVAVRAQRVIDEPGGGRPALAVERRLVQRSHDAVERIPFAHDGTFPCARSAGPISIGSVGKNPLLLLPM